MGKFPKSLGKKILKLNKGTLRVTNCVLLFIKYYDCLYFFKKLLLELGSNVSTILRCLFIVQAIDVWMSFCIIAVFAAMLEFALVNTLARKEIRRLSMRVRKTEKIDNNSDLPSDMVKKII